MENILAGQRQLGLYQKCRTEFRQFNRIVARNLFCISLSRRIKSFYKKLMGRQILFFAAVCAIWAFFHRDVQSEFLDIWFRLKASGQVTNADYDAAWVEFILPRIALFTLSIVPVIVVFSLEVDRRIRHKRRSKRLHLSIRYS